MSCPKIKEKPPVKVGIKEKGISSPKELVRRGTAASASKLMEEVKAAAKPTPTGEEQPETVSAEATATAARKARQQAVRKIYTAKRAKLKEKPGAETAEVPPEATQLTMSRADIMGSTTPNIRQDKSGRKRTVKKATVQGSVPPTIADNLSTEKGPSNNLRLSREKSQASTTAKEIKRKDTAPKEPHKTIKDSARTKNTGIKTVERSTRTVPTANMSMQNAQHVQMRSVKARKRSATAKGAAKAAEVAKKLTASVKNLGAVLGAGGGVIVAVTLVIILAAGLLCSPLGIFFSSETESELTLQQVMSQLNTEFADKISEIESTVPHDEVEQTGQRALWKDVLAIYAVKTTTDAETTLDAATMDEAHAEVLREIFWDMNQIDYTTETYTEEVPVEAPDESSTEEGTDATEFVEKIRLIITITSKTAEEVASEYGFDQEQLGYVAGLLSDEYSDLWSMLSVGGGSDDIVAVAVSQVGNVGGEPYWRWYGYSSRVSWCACFVSWCGDQCGYIDAGILPKFSYCDTGVEWFKSRGQWQNRDYVPSPGCVIFFDWNSNGTSDHVAIVEYCDGATVYTIEGNANDTVMQLSYAAGDWRIVGYGLIEK